MMLLVVVVSNAYSSYHVYQLIVPSHEQRLVLDVMGKYDVVGMLFRASMPFATIFSISLSSQPDKSLPSIRRIG